MAKESMWRRTRGVRVLDEGPHPSPTTPLRSGYDVPRERGEGDRRGKRDRPQWAGFASWRSAVRVCGGWGCAV